MKDQIKIYKKAFTLIELLVVISIISLLMSILIPSLHKAKEQARKAICMSNMHQMAIGVGIYADTYNGYCVPATCAAFSGGNSYTWFLSTGDPQGYNPNSWLSEIHPQQSGYGLLYDLGMVKSGKIYYCPSEIKSDPARFADGRTYYFTYDESLFGKKLGVREDNGRWNRWVVWTYNSITWPLNWGPRKHVKLDKLTSLHYPIVWDNCGVNVGALIGNNMRDQRVIKGHGNASQLNTLYGDGHVTTFRELSRPQNIKYDTTLKLGVRIAGPSMLWINGPCGFQRDFVEATKGL